MRARSLAIAVAAFTVGAGVVRAVSGARSDDLLQVHSWLVYWLFESANPYTGVTAVNYPPHAFIVLGPLGLIPQSVVPVVWAALNAILAPVVAWWLVRDWPMSRHDRVIVTALVTSWNAVMTGIWMGQFTLLSILFGLVGLRTIQTPWIAGAWLAASAIKPHMGVIFLGWALVRGHYRALLSASLWAAAGLVAMSLWAQTSPVTIVQTWLGVLAWMFGADSPQRGVTEWWGLIEHRLPMASAGLMRTAGALAGVALLAIALRKMVPRDPTGRITLALLSLWSLATLFHRRYDLILLAPAFAWLWVSARHRRVPRRWPWAALLALHVALVIDIPWAWQVYHGPQATTAGPLAWLALQCDRLLILGTIVAVWMVRDHAVLITHAEAPTTDPPAGRGAPATTLQPPPRR